MAKVLEGQGEAEVTPSQTEAGWREPLLKGGGLREVRSIARSRRRLAIATFVAVAGAVLATTAGGPTASAGTVPGEPHRVGAPPQGSARVTSRSFGAAFSPGQVVASDGHVWLVSSGNGNSAGCRIGLLSPGTMALTTYSLPACGTNVVAGTGAIFLEVPVADVKSQTYAVHIERFSTSTHASTVFGTVSATMSLGSDIAHTQLAYADASLWLHAYQRGAPQVLQLSPSTGAVERRYSSVPEIGGTEPLITGAQGYVWLAGGAGSGADFLRVDVSNGATRAFQLPGRYASVYDLAWASGRLFYLYLDYPAASSPAGTALTSHVGRWSPSSGQPARSPSEGVGTWLVPLGTALYSAGPSSSCTAASLTVWRVDEQTLRTSVVAHLRPPGNPCAGEGFRSVAAEGKSIFVLSGSALYRVTPAD